MADEPMNAAAKAQKLGVVQQSALFVLRVAVGWHFLYEGIVKLVDPSWTSAPYLAESKWIFSDLFHWMASTPSVLKVVDLLNIWGLTLIGAALLLGILPRFASLGGIFLLSLYYAANPPLVGITSGVATEGHYLVVDKNVVELVGLIVIAAFPSAGFLCMDRLFAALRRRKGVRTPVVTDPGSILAPSPAVAPQRVSVSRREIFKGLVALPFLGGFVFAYLKKRGWDSHEEKQLLATMGGDVDAVTTATIKTFTYASLKDLKGQVPRGRIGDLDVSRLICGGNLIGGWAHARDLIYVSKLIKTYHTDQKVFDTLRLAEQCGINTLLTNPQLSRVINAYWRKEGGKIQFFSDCGFKGDAIEGARLSLDGGAQACYVQGEISDRRVRDGDFDHIAKALDFIRANKVPAGIGAHHIETVKACVEKGLKPDFWVKTLHSRNYWSANAQEQHDNIWCVSPEETIEYMAGLAEPWIAFKVLAAGALPPNEAFKFAFQGGADFICVGMYDFQVVEDVNIALDVLAQPVERRRRWLA